MTGWSEGLGPWTPVPRGRRSTAEAAPTTATRRSPALPRSRRSRRRASPTRAASSWSRPARRAAAPTCPPTWTRWPAIGAPGLVICLDSGCGNYDQLWMATSLRGPGRRGAVGRGTGRGDAFGRQRDRALELPDPAPASLPPGGRADRRILHAPLPLIPPERLQQAERRGRARGHERPAYRCPRMRPRRRSRGAALPHTWRPALAITGRRGSRPSQTPAMSSPADGGEVSPHSPDRSTPHAARGLKKPSRDGSTIRGACPIQRRRRPAGGWISRRPLSRLLRPVAPARLHDALRRPDVGRVGGSIRS